MNELGNLEKTAKEWVKAERKAGKSDEELRSEMLRKGYAPGLINRVLAEKKISKLWIIIPLILIIAAAVYFALPFIIPLVQNITLTGKSCSTQECFISAANNCEAVKMEQNEAGSLFRYSTSNCIMTKTLSKINGLEPAEIKSLLEGKSLECAYEKGAFNTYWISALSIGLENCSGELKDAIDELSYAV